MMGFQSGFRSGTGHDKLQRRFVSLGKRASFLKNDRQLDMIPIRHFIWSHVKLQHRWKMPTVSSTITPPKAVITNQRAQVFVIPAWKRLLENVLRVHELDPRVAEGLNAIFLIFVCGLVKCTKSGCFWSKPVFLLNHVESKHQQKH